ncbi:MAG: caspase family protein [Nitrospirae bacterium]|nr:caspase family protein [Nitrospirota bacterium]
MVKAALKFFLAIIFLAGVITPAHAQEKPEIFVQLGHKSAISTLAISPDGKYLASADDNTGGRNIKIWDMLSGREFRTIIVETNEMIRCLRFSVDAKQIFVVTFTKIYAFDVYSGNNLKIIDVGHLPNMRDDFWMRGRIDGIFSDYGFSVSKQIVLRTYDSGRETERKVDNFIYALLRKGKEGYDYILEVRRMSDRVKVRQIELNSLTFFVEVYDNVIFTPDLKHLITAHGDVDKDGKMVFTGTISIWDLKTGQKVRELGKVKPTGFMALSYPFSLDNRFLYNLNAADKESQIVWDIKSGRLLYYIQKGEMVPEEYSSFVKKNFVDKKDGKIKVSISKSESSDQKFKAIIDWRRDHTIRIYEKTTNKELAQFISFTDGEWIVITPEGYFNASPNGAKHLNVRVGNKVYGVDQFYSKFYRPELVKLALAGKEIPKGEMLTDIASQKPAPAVEILSPRSGITVSEDMIKITVKLKDNGGGIGDVSIYLNGSQIANDTRGVVIKGKEFSSEKALDFNISLMEGNNDIKIIAFNKEGSMESIPAILSVFSKVVLQKPNLYAIVVGINEYKNKNISLNYAVSDAKAFTETLKATAKTLFENINAMLLISSDETTKESIQKAFEEIRTRVKPNDLFVFYNASHGVIDIVEDQEQYYLLTSNVLSFSSRQIGRDAMSQKELIQLIGAIPAQKKLIILDTCHAGKAGKEITVALLQQTRGLTESTAIKLLQRAIGSTVFSASSDTQQALEGYKGHGLFTYVLNEGMQGGADMNKDGFIKVNELADYVEERVITLSEQVFKRQQTPTTQIGVNFPIGKVK